MSTMSWKARHYGELLGAACGVEVRLECSGRPACRPWDGWVAQWWDGPTEEQMRRVAADTLPCPDGSSGPVPAAELSYSRCLSTLGEATALLIWLERHPDVLRDIGAVHLVAARDEVAYPERVDDVLRRRARALLCRSPSGTVGYEVLRELSGPGRRGWVAVQEWLDGPAPMVVDLAAERARRRVR